MTSYKLSFTIESDSADPSDLLDRLQDLAQRLAEETYSTFDEDGSTASVLTLED